MGLRPAVFLDRDGVVIEEVHYLADPSQVRLLPGAAEAIARLNCLGIPVIVATNQAGVAHGLFPEPRVAAVHGRLDELLAGHDAHVDRYDYCPHHPAAKVPQYRRVCECRKPSPGMLIHAARECGIDLRRSFLVGDKLSDLEAGRRAGCRVLLVRTGYGAEMEGRLAELGLDRVQVAGDLSQAVSDCILRDAAFLEPIGYRAA